MLRQVPPPQPLEGGPAFCNITIRFWQGWMHQSHFSLSQESGKCFLITCRWNDHLAQSYAEQGTPTPRPLTGTSPRPVRTRAAYQEANCGPTRNFMCCPPPSHSSPGRKTVFHETGPWSHRSRGPLMYGYTLTVCMSQGSPEKHSRHSVSAYNIETCYQELAH